MRVSASHPVLRDWLAFCTKKKESVCVADTLQSRVVHLPLSFGEVQKIVWLSCARLLLTCENGVLALLSFQPSAEMKLDLAFLVSLASLACQNAKGETHCQFCSNEALLKSLFREGNIRIEKIQNFPKSIVDLTLTTRNVSCPAKVSLIILFSDYSLELHCLHISAPSPAMTPVRNPSMSTLEFVGRHVLEFARGAEPSIFEPGILTAVASFSAWPWKEGELICVGTSKSRLIVLDLEALTERWMLGMDTSFVSAVVVDAFTGFEEIQPSSFLSLTKRPDIIESENKDKYEENNEKENENQNQSENEKEEIVKESRKPPDSERTCLALLACRSLPSNCSGGLTGQQFCDHGDCNIQQQNFEIAALWCSGTVTFHDLSTDLLSANGQSKTSSSTHSCPAHSYPAHSYPAHSYPAHSYPAHSYSGEKSPEELLGDFSGEDIVRHYELEITSFRAGSMQLGSGVHHSSLHLFNSARDEAYCIFDVNAPTVYKKLRKLDHDPDNGLSLQNSPFLARATAADPIGPRPVSQQIVAPPHVRLRPHTLTKWLL